MLANKTYLYIIYSLQNSTSRLHFSTGKYVLLVFCEAQNKGALGKEISMFLSQQLPLLHCLPLCFHSQNCFELYIPDNKDQVIKACKTEADGRVVEGNHTVYRISAPTPEEKEEWIKCIK